MGLKVPVIKVDMEKQIVIGRGKSLLQNSGWMSKKSHFESIFEK